MKEYYSNYLGICINNQDPEYRGRVQIFIPHIMPALYEGWNLEGQDITIECVGNNLPNGLRSDIIEKLKKILPWSEGAMPVVGASVGGSYNSATGNFNQTACPGGTFGAPGSGSNSFNPSDNLTKFVASIGARETGFSVSEAYSNYYNASATEAGVSYRNANVAKAVAGGMSLAAAQAEFGDYGFYQTNQADVRDAINRGVSPSIAAAMNNGGGTGNYTLEQQTAAIAAYIQVLNPTAAAAASQGDWSTANSLLNGKWPSLPGGNSYNTSLDSKANTFLNGGTINLSQPATCPTPGSFTPAPPAYMFPDGGPYYQQQPSPTTTTAPTTGSSPGNLAQKAQAAAFSSGSFGAGSTSNCGKIARGIDYNILQDNYFLNSTGGNSRGSANVSVPYWVRSGYYQVETTIPDTIPFGSKIVFAVGKGDTNRGATGSATNGHVTTVGENGALFGSIAGESFAGYNNIRGDQRVTILTPTQLYRDKYRQLYGTNLPEYASSSVTSGAGTVPIDDGSSDNSSTLFPNPSPTQILPTDMTGMPAGVFAIPKPGAMLWVFFREGNPLFPVYFAASFGRNEWQNAYRANSEPGFYGETTVQSSGIAGATITNSSLNNPYTRNISFAGSFKENNLRGEISYVNGNKEGKYEGSWNLHTNGRQFFNLQDDIHNVLGNTRVIVGNPSQENLQTIEEQTRILKEAQKPLLQGSESDSESQQQTASTSELPARGSNEWELQRLNLEELNAARDMAQRMADLEKQLSTPIN